MTCSCGNEARYIDIDGAFRCGVCPIKAGRDSIRISDVPRLLGFARDLQREFAHRALSGAPFEVDREMIDALGALIGPAPAQPTQYLPSDVSLVPWPKHHPTRQNGGVVCDMWTGPCSCGAWHTEGQ